MAKRPVSRRTARTSNSVKARSPKVKRRSAGHPKPPADGGGGGGQPALLIVLATNLVHLEDAVAVLIDMGIAATVIQTRPLTSVLRDDLPMFAGVASLLPKMPESRLLVSITTTDLADRALALLSHAGTEASSGLFVATVGLRGFYGTVGAAPR